MEDYSNVIATSSNMISKFLCYMLVLDKKFRLNDETIATNNLKIVEATKKNHKQGEPYVIRNFYVQHPEPEYNKSVQKYENSVEKPYQNNIDAVKTMKNILEKLYQKVGRFEDSIKTQHGYMKQQEMDLRIETSLSSGMFVSLRQNLKKKIQISLS